MVFLFLAAIVLFVVALVLLALAIAKKTSKKKALIVFLSGVACFILSVALAPATTTTESTDSLETEEITKNDEKEDIYKIGDVIKVTTSDGSYSLTITGVHETKDRNQFSDVKADRVIILDYSYENIDVDDELYIFESNFKAYDAENNSLETYPADTKSAKSISAGRKTEGQMAFALNSKSNKVELEYFDNMFNDNRDCLIVVEW